MARCDIRIDTRDVRPGVLVIARSARRTKPLAPQCADRCHPLRRNQALGRWRCWRLPRLTRTNRPTEDAPAACAAEMPVCGVADQAAGGGGQAPRPRPAEVARGAMKKDTTGRLRRRGARAPFGYPGASLGLCNNGRITDYIVPRQPVEHRLSLTTTGPARSRHANGPSTWHFRATCRCIMKLS